MTRVRLEQGYKKPELELDFQSKAPVPVEPNWILKISIRFQVKPDRIFKKVIWCRFKLNRNSSLVHIPPTLDVSALGNLLLRPGALNVKKTWDDNVKDIVIPGLKTD